MRHIKIAAWLLSLAAVVTTAGTASGQEQTPATTATTSGAPAADAASASAEPVSPGPLLEARKMLWMRINLAKSEGIGTSTYVTAFKGLDEEVKNGKTADEMRPRIESLARSLKDQLDRAKILKTQRPIPPTSSQTASGSMSMPSPSAAPSGGGGGLGGLGGVAAALGGGNDLDKLKAELMNGGGGNIEALKQRAMQTKKGREFLEKLGL